MKSAPALSFTPVVRPVLQRKCACGGTPGPTGECEACKRKRLALRPKLAINQPGDRYEQEADRVAEKIMRGERSGAPSVSSLGGWDTVEHKEAGNTKAARASSIVDEVLQSPGQPLDAGTRVFMEEHLGYDFGRVRVHTDVRANESARAVSAEAYTVGSHVVFEDGRFSPDSNEGKRLLAHELVHVIQQRDYDSVPNGLEIAEARSALESEAAAGERSLGSNSKHTYNKTAAALARQPKKADDETPPREGKPGTASSSQSPLVQMPACVAKGVDQFIPDPQKPNVQLWGLTPFSGVGGQQPDLTVAPAPSGKGAVVQPTRASLPAIQMQFMKPGRYFDKLSTIAAQAGGALPAGSYPVVWNLTKGGSEKIKAGEQEHCDDLQLAFYFSLYRFAEIVNEMAAKGTEFKDEAAARAALRKQAAIEPQNLPAYFKCLGETMARKRDSSHWHDPPPPKAERASVEYDRDVGRTVAVIEFNEKSLPEVGKHGSVDLLANHAAPACVGFTNLKPAKP